MGGGSGDDDGDLEGGRGGGKSWGEFSKEPASLSRVEGGGHIEYRMPDFPDFGPQSLATLHGSSSSSSTQHAARSTPGRVR